MTARSSVCSSSRSPHCRCAPSPKPPTPGCTTSGPTGGRHEIDFIVEGDDGILAIEAKLAGAIDDHDVRHLRWLRSELGSDLIDTVILHTGPEAYRRPDGVAVVPLGLLGP